MKQEKKTKMENVDTRTRPQTQTHYFKTRLPLLDADESTVLSVHDTPLHT